MKLIHYITPDGVSIFVNPDRIVCAVFNRDTRSSDWRATVQVAGMVGPDKAPGLIVLTHPDFGGLANYVQTGEAEA